LSAARQQTEGTGILHHSQKPYDQHIVGTIDGLSVRSRLIDVAIDRPHSFKIHRNWKTEHFPVSIFFGRDKENSQQQQ
jgi:hypothetical protein